MSNVSPGDPVNLQSCSTNRRSAAGAREDLIQNLRSPPINLAERLTDVRYAITIQSCSTNRWRSAAGERAGFLRTSSKTLQPQIYHLARGRLRNSCCTKLAHHVVVEPPSALDEVSTYMYVHVSSHVGSLGGFIHAALSLNYYAVVRGQLRSLRLECFPSQGLAEIFTANHSQRSPGRGL